MVCAYVKFVDAMIDNFLAIMEQKVLVVQNKVIGKLELWAYVAQPNVMADT